jgi:hypothetical protein
VSHVLTGILAYLAGIGTTCAYIWWTDRKGEQ